MKETKYYYEEETLSEKRGWLSWGAGYNMTCGEALLAMARRRENNPDAILRLVRADKTTWENPEDAQASDSPKNEKEMLADLLREVNGSWTTFEDWAEKILVEGFHHESVWNERDRELREFSDAAVNDAISTFIEMRQEIEDLRQSLRFIADEGGKVVETECGDITCDGNFCADQARTALETIGQNTQ